MLTLPKLPRTRIRGPRPMPPLAKGALEGYREEMIAITDAALGRLRVGDTLDLNQAMVDLTLRIALKCLFNVEPRDGEENLGTMATEFLAGLISPGAMLFPR